VLGHIHGSHAAFVEELAEGVVPERGAGKRAAGDHRRIILAGPQAPRAAHCTSKGDNGALIAFASLAYARGLKRAGHNYFYIVVPVLPLDEGAKLV
jgi:hypothetical protein